MIAVLCSGTSVGLASGYCLGVACHHTEMETLVKIYSWDLEKVKNREEETYPKE